MRQVVLDTETTGLEPSQGHRIIEIGCVEVIDRKLTGNHYHQYINPQREVESSAIEVHGITNEFLADKPIFKDIAAEFLAFINGAELVIHNAAFDIGFINHEFLMLQDSPGKVEQYCGVLDTLALARKKHPGQRNSLDALCKRYGIDNSMRDLHGALLDSEILADVYLIMTGGQTMLSLGGDNASEEITGVQRLPSDRPSLQILRASAQELADHESRLDAIEKQSGSAIWRAQ
ncbi:DNA polymerase III subunit epsilon [Alkalimarinus coralli]|uniref:DNA polymerase III subunit epsilon n=1 Tax=Alkalimarinus coralli TaxID=2935863 RepID=UPI00202AD319|nr:DNA polymerase III subunit epsilon [Alkalimarinus coralli]